MTVSSFHVHRAARCHCLALCPRMLSHCQPVLPCEEQIFGAELLPAACALHSSTVIFVWWKPRLSPGQQQRPGAQLLPVAMWSLGMLVLLSARNQHKADSSIEVLGAACCPCILSMVLMALTAVYCW